MKLTRLLFCLVALGCNSGPVEVEPPPADGFNVLFIGNSLTYTNDLPSIVAALADSLRLPLHARAVAFPNYNLEDHWAAGDAVEAIRLGHWDYVVLQQGPSSVQANREQLIASTKQFDVEIKRVGGKAALFSAWPTSDRRQDYPAASTSYRLAAEAVGGLMLPVADAWRIAMEKDANIALYSPDGLHPSLTGSYLSALVIFAQLYQRSPVGLPATVRTPIGTFQIAASIAAVLQSAAAEAIAQHR